MRNFIQFAVKRTRPDGGASSRFFFEADQELARSAASEGEERSTRDRTRLRIEHGYVDEGADEIPTRPFPIKADARQKEDVDERAQRRCLITRRTLARR